MGHVLGLGRTEVGLFDVGGKRTAGSRHAPLPIGRLGVGLAARGLVSPSGETAGAIEGHRWKFNESCRADRAVLI